MIFVTYLEHKSEMESKLLFDRYINHCCSYARKIRNLIYMKKLWIHWTCFNA